MLETVVDFFECRKNRSACMLEGIGTDRVEKVDTTCLGQCHDSLQLTVCSGDTLLLLWAMDTMRLHSEKNASMRFLINVISGCS